MPSDAFAEALALVPLIHLPVTPGQRVLIVGRDAVPAAMSALRYPQTVEVVIVDETGALPLGDKRARQVARLEQIPPGWIADLVVVAMPVLTDSLVQAVRLHHRADSGVAAFALARPAQIRQAKEILRKNWSTVQPYRENVPEAVELENRTAWFLLAADHGFKRHRPIPPWAKRLSDKYVPALFTLARDEYTLAYGSGQA